MAEDRSKKGLPKDQANKRTFNPPGGPGKESQHDETDKDEKGRMGNYTGPGEHSRDSDKGKRGK